jgi:hypothetical protein
MPTIALVSITLMTAAIVKVDQHLAASIDLNRPWLILFLIGAVLGCFPLFKAKVGGWIKVAIVSALFTALEAYGLHLSDIGQATNRAWVSPCVWGFLLAVSSIVPCIGMLLTGRTIKEVSRIVLYFVVAGTSPTIAAFVLTALRRGH